MYLKLSKIRIKKHIYRISFKCSIHICRACNDILLPKQELQLPIIFGPVVSKQDNPVEPNNAEVEGCLFFNCLFKSNI